MDAEERLKSFKIRCEKCESTEVEAGMAQGETVLGESLLLIFRCLKCGHEELFSKPVERNGEKK